MTKYYSEKLTDNQILNIPLFANISENMVAVLQDLLEINEYKQGKYIFKEGDEADKVFFIIEGSVQVVKKSLTNMEKSLDELICPEFFGEMGLIDMGKRSASVIANSKLITAELNYKDCFQVFSEKPELAILIYKNLAKELSFRIRHLNIKFACT